MRADKLKKLGMPKRPMAEEDAGMDFEMELGAEDEEMMDEEAGDEEEMMMDEEVDLFEDIEDDMLIEEMKKRGLAMPEEEEMEDEEEMGEDELDMGELY